MKKQLIALLLIIWFSSVHGQNFISDSLMSIYVESGIANQTFQPEGKSKKDVRVGKWIDYTFEFIYTYQQNDDVVDASFKHLLIQSTGKYSNGQKNGLWCFYAVVEGTFKKYHIANVTYKNGKREGPITLFYSSGEKAAEGNCENEIIQGTVTVYYKTGEVAQRFKKNEGSIQGILSTFYQSGENRATLNFVNGLRNGTETTYYKNGAVKSKRNFLNDTIRDTSIYYYPNGSIQEEDIYKNGEISEWRYYYESGQLWVQKEYKDGKYFNILQLYDLKGTPLDHGTLKDGNGTVKYYTEDTKIYLIRTFESGEIINEERFDL
jgi:antitoxin component YwqK of YwqJK toxin-antitoxin module